MKFSTKLEKKEKENFKKVLFTPDDKEFYKISIEKNNIIFNFLYTSLNTDFRNDFEKISNEDISEPNAFVYAIKLFSSAFDHMITMFSHPEDLCCFSEDYSINIFLAKDFDEICSVGNSTKQNLPSFVKGRTSGTTLIYLQDFFVNNSKKYVSELSEKRVLGTAHELLHIYFKYNHSAKYKNYNNSLPFLFNEGLTVICANQITKDFAGPFVSPDQLFLENGIQVFKYDKRWITENAYYQSAGYFMDYLLKTISKNEKIYYKEAFQKVFDTIGCPKSFDDKKNFSAKKYMKNVFGLDIVEEYNKFLERKVNK